MRTTQAEMSNSHKMILMNRFFWCIISLSKDSWNSLVSGLNQT